ncbi:hypothetical protein [Nitrosomonas supralitoralis]|uniref:hypothetical protein n=1 Tax=Nitrosomonas supralitoralis TaxID=2116706 RepID=UPI001559043E|nr:hypothetical protein [Nitrosomonas supralitoralis]
MNIDRWFFAILGILSLIAGGIMLDDGDASGGWSAILFGGAILTHLALSKKI